MKVVSTEEMREIDRLAQADFALTSYDLMRETGCAIAEAIESRYHPHFICIVCGKGNNAGDGFVIARNFHEMGREVTVICIDENPTYAGAALEAWNHIRDTKIKILPAHELSTAIDQCDIVIDALLGTGIKGAPRENYAQAITTLNCSSKTIVAVDVPSGLHEESDPNAGTPVVKADTTYAIGLPKTILLTLPGSWFTGEVRVLPINFPSELLQSDNWKLNWAPPDDLAAWLPPRRPDSNKGSFGNVGITGGALSYAGASILVARAALRAGCGLATIYTLPDTNAIYKTALPEATSVILESGNPRFFDQASGESFVSDHKSHSVLCVGPGLGTAPETGDFLWAVLKSWNGPLVLDADALNILSDGMLGLIGNRAGCLLTPHPGEMSRLTGLSIVQVQADRETVAREFAVRHGITVLLKGADTLIARPDGQVWLIPGAEPALAKGGTGDVLTGVIGSLFSQGMPMWQAAVLGASAHLQAGKSCAKKFGNRGVLASEVADEIPRILDLLLSSKPV